MVKIVAEIGINHNGSIDIAKKMILLAVVAGCDYVKFQKRNPDVCVPDDQKNKIKQTPVGKMTYLEYKKWLEFGKEEFNEIDKYCRQLNIGWFASVWDRDSVDFMKNYTGIMKIPSAHLTNTELLKYTRRNCSTMLMSTGMSTEEEIFWAVEIGNPDVIFHTNSTYPTPIDELNLDYIRWLKEKYSFKSIGYSGHEYGLVTTFATIPLGVEWVERHITIDRNMWGSDQQASIEPSGLIKLVKGIRDIEKSLSGYKERECWGGELEKKKSLRK